MARRHRVRRNPTPGGTALGVIGVGGTIASLYYAMTAMATLDADKAKKRAFLAGGVLLGTIGLVSIAGETNARRRAIA